MNREVEERIVAMYFDNQDFEKNAKATIETLGQLKESLNIEDSANKGFSVFDKIGKALKFDEANRGLTTMRGKLNSMNGAVGKIFKIGQQPLREAESAFNSLRGYVSKVFGFDLASKLVGNIESAFRNLTVAPISAGWDQYQSKMDSVKTIMSSTGESIETVEKHLKEMTEYANKTVYSLTDMTSNLGKFTNNGIELERATKAMEGIANATADAGQGAQSASMAMYNISQAMGVGKMTTIDWKSLENANIATQRLKNTFLEMAAASGKLKKEVSEVNGKQTTKFFLETDEAGKKLKERIELNAANFREYLSKGWLDKETMLRTFELYSGQGINENILKSWGITDPEEQRNLLKIGENALEAAQQVRTFSKMMDALKESVQSGWAESFEIIFGNMEEGTELWTRLNEKFDSILSASSKRRNDILKGWAEMTEDGQSYWTLDGKGNRVLNQGVKGGRDILVDSFFEMIDVIKDFASAVKDTFGSVFGEIDAQKLFSLTLKFRDFVNGMKEWLGSTDDASSRISKLMKGLSGVFNIVKAGINVIKSLWKLFKQALGPVVDWLIDKFANFGEFFNNAFGNASIGGIIRKFGQAISQMWDSIKKFFSKREGENESPFAKWANSLWSGFKKTMRKWANDNGLGSILDSIIDIWNKFKGVWDTIVNWGFWGQIGQFATNVWSWIQDTFGGAWEFFTAPDEETGKTGFVAWIEDVWNAIKDFWENTIVKNGKPIWEGIGNFISNTWGWIQEQLGIGGGGNANEDSRGFPHTAVQEDSPVVKWLKGLWEGIQSFWNNTIVGTAKTLWIAIGDFLSDTWVWIKDLCGINNDEPTEAPDTTGDNSLFGWLKSSWEAIKKFWNENIVGGGGTLLENVAGFLGNTWEWLQRKFLGSSSDVDSRGYPHTAVQQDAPVVQWLSDIWDTIKTTWDNIVHWEFWGSIASFAVNTWGWITAQFKPTRYADANGHELKNQKAPIVTWLEDIWDKIKSVWSGIVGWEGWRAIGDFLGNTWEWITGLFKGDNAATAGSNSETIKSAEATQKGSEKTLSITEKTVGFLERIFGAISNFFQKVGGAVTSLVIPPEINSFLTAFGNFFKGILNRLTILLQSGGNLLNGNGGWTDITNIVGVILPIILVKIGELFNNKYLAGASGAQSFATKFILIAGGLFLMATAVATLTTLDSAKMWEAVGAVTVLGVIVGVITGVLARLTKNASLKETVTTTMAERIINNLVGVIGKVAVLAVAMKILPEIIRAIGEAKNAAGGADIGQDALNIMLGLTALISATSLVMAITQKIGGAGGLSITGTVKTMVAIVAGLGTIIGLFAAGGGLMELVEGIFGQGSIEAIRGGIEKVGILIEGVGQAIGSFFKGIAAAFGFKTENEKVESTKQIMEDMSNFSDVINSEKITGISRIMTMMVNLSKEAQSLDTTAIEGFSKGMQELAYGILSMNWIIDGVEDLRGLGDVDSASYKKAEASIAVVESLFKAFGHLVGLDTGNLQAAIMWVNEMGESRNDGIGRFASNLKIIVDELSALGLTDDSGISFDGLTIAGKLYDAIQTGLQDPMLPKFDATSIVDDICDALSLGNSAIAFLVHEMVQNGIDLSGKGENGQNYSLDDGTVELLQQILGTNGPEVDLNNLTDVSKLTDQLFGKDGKGGILGELNSFEDQMPSLASMFSEKGWMDFTDENGQEIDLLGEIQSHLTDLGTTLNGMEPLQVRITPVFDWSNLTPEAMQAEMNNRPIGLTTGIDSGTLALSFEGLSQELDMESIRTRLDSIVTAVMTYGANAATAVSGLAGHMDGIAAEVARLKLVIDTGALVGQIMPYVDKSLNKAALNSQRTGVVNYTTP